MHQCKAHTIHRASPNVRLTLRPPIGMPCQKVGPPCTLRAHPVHFALLWKHARTVRMRVSRAAA
jgi:hypothetical protein